MLDKPEVLAGVTEQPRFPPWEFNTHSTIRPGLVLKMFYIQISDPYCGPFSASNSKSLRIQKNSVKILNFNVSPTYAL